MSIILRAIELEDLDFLFKIENMQGMWSVGDDKAPISRRDLETYLLTYDRNPLRAGQLRLVIAEPTSDNPVGLIDLYDIDALNKNAKVGIAILREFRKKGYARQAIALLQNYCSNILHIKALSAYVSIKNIASIKAFEASGFKLCGTLPKWLQAATERVDMLIYSHTS